MNLYTEIRKLNPADSYKLVQILEYDESWKKLMAIIPKTLNLDDFNCKIAVNNLPKYNSDHFKLIDSAGLKQKRPCAEILLDEWGTSGRIRPRLGHLMYLLKRTELLRAADFISIQLLKMHEVERPSTGPAAKVLIPDDKHLQNLPLRDESINIPSSLLEEQPISSTIFNRIQESIPAHVIPRIIINDIDNREINPHPQIEKIQNHVHFCEPLSSEDDNATDNTQNQNNSFTDNDPAGIPAFSVLMNESTSIPPIPALSDLIELQTESTNNFTSNEPANIPILTDLLGDSSDISNPNLSAYNIPALSEIFPLNTQNSIENVNPPINNSQNIPNILYSNETADNIPAFSKILDSNLSSASEISNNEILNLQIDNSKITRAASTGSNSSRSCVSPLPNLTLKTILPHITYLELEQHTNYFDETFLNAENSSDLERSAMIGRKLGSGAFGSVYLALGLLERPVAVKKLNLNGVNVVNVDDTITKQFKNEVELLCKYKHENLMSLLGYSCDGPTYCLIYEYVCGGALKDRLQKCLNRSVDYKLLWPDRLYIALGTAKAVSYLHSAYSTPLIHRDIKSANILLDSGNKPKLCDFGLIKLTPNPNTNTGTTVFGTSAYMAPEAFRGDVSTKLDTFSFGVVLLELLTSLPPLDENREGIDLITHIEEEVINGDIKPLLDVTAGSWNLNNIHFGENLYEIAIQCLEEKKKRPVMSAVVANLSQLIDKSVTN